LLVFFSSNALVCDPKFITSDLVPAQRKQHKKKNL
jgi:hypothetical protein